MTKLKLVNDYQKRIEKNPNGGGEYQFYGIPNDEEGNLFIKLARKYLNRKLYRTVKYGRSNGSYYLSAAKSSESLVMICSSATLINSSTALRPARIIFFLVSFVFMD